MNPGTIPTRRNRFVGQVALPSVAASFFVSIPHGLQALNLCKQWVLVNLKADLGYSPGDEVGLEYVNSAHVAGAVNGNAAVVSCDGAASITIPTKSGSANSALSGVSFWALKVYVWRFDPNAM